MKKDLWQDVVLGLACRLSAHKDPVLLVSSVRVDF